MKIIKFRAWQSNKNKMLSHEDMIKGGWGFNEFNSDVSQIEIMQYTGLKDKNGKEVYEGDIVELEEPTSTSNPLDMQNYIKKAEVVMYVGNILQPHFKDINRNNSIFGKALLTSRKVKKVIGNIYENKVW